MKTLLKTEDFVEMLKRGDSPEWVANYMGVRTPSVERRFHRLPKQIKNEIIKSRGGESFRWWQYRTKEKK